MVYAHMNERKQQFLHSKGKQKSYRIVFRIRPPTMQNLKTRKESAHQLVGSLVFGEASLTRHTSSRAECIEL